MSAEGALSFLGDLGVEDLPGVGWSLRAKLSELGIQKVGGIVKGVDRGWESPLGTAGST